MECVVMEPSSKSRTSRTENNSSDVLNADNLSIFGEISSRNALNKNSSKMSDRLNLERIKALEALRKAKGTDTSPRHRSMANKDDNKRGSNVLINSQKLDRTDYISFRRPCPINISDLITDETINLENSASGSASLSKDVKISFEPAEMTGRSTVCKGDLKEQNRSKTFSSSPSVSEILASSFAPKARDLCETLRGDDITSNLSLNPQLVSTASEEKSSFTNCDGSRSLPHTADLSISKASCSELSFNCGARFSFNPVSGNVPNEYLSSTEEFAPAELMESKLLLDEISWAQEHAAIPTKTLSKKAKEKAKLSDLTSNGFESSTVSNSMLTSDPNFSVGKFFNMRSDNICNIVPSRSPEKWRTPIALVDGENKRAGIGSRNSVTSRIENKTFVSPMEARREETKNCGDCYDNSYLLSMSAIDRALYKLDIMADDSERGIIDQLLQAKNSKTVKDSCREVHKAVVCREEDISSLKDMILENKENLDPRVIHSASKAASDTLSFRNSLLTPNDMKELQRSNVQPRSPLSPIDLREPNTRNSRNFGGNEADIDEWPSTPIKSPNRRIRRSKSPAPIVESSDGTTPTTRIQGSSSNSVQPKSLSSTRLDGHKTSVAEYDFGVSPNNLDSRNTLGIRNGTVLTVNGKSPSRNGSPSHFENSPLSSPHSCVSSQVSSPINIDGYRSTHLDSTTSSDRRFLTVGSTHRVASSFVVNEESKSCMIPAVPSYTSGNILKSNGTTNVVGRSISRCSSSSEFSHRDGKPIPLKVTTMELSWGSTKLRTDSRKSMQIKNIANKRLVVRIEISGPGFQIVNSQRSNTVTLQSQECRSISISFYPTVQGLALGTLSFFAPLGVGTANTSFLDIPLYAYGGHASILVQNVLKGPVGSAFVPMGEMCELAQPLERSITIYNKGSLLGFAVVTIDSLGLTMPRLCDAFEIYPQKTLITPGHMSTVRIVFRPKREEIKKIIKKINNVLTLANLRIICGDDANRQRMRRLVQRMSDEERLKISSNTLDLLWTEFPDEVEMNELVAFKEQPKTALDLVSGFRVHEIALTINYDSLDETSEASSLFFPEVDETVLFRTVCAAASPTPPTTLCTVDELLEAEDADDERVVSSSRDGSWSVSPSVIEFDFNMKHRFEHVSLMIRNFFKSRQYFEVDCNYKDLLHFIPSKGYVAPDGGQIEVEVNAGTFTETPRDEILILVYMESECITVPVKTHQ